MSCLRLARVALCTRGAFVHEAGGVAWPISKDSAPRAPFFQLDSPTAFASRARWMKVRKVSVARQLHYPHEARAPVVVITDQQATECRRRRVDHKVGERKPALVSDGDIDLALQTLDEFLPHVIRRLYGLDNAVKHKNITSTTCGIQRIHIQSYTSTCQRRKLMPTCCAYWLPGIPRQSNANNQKNITNTTCCIQRIQIQSYTSTCQRRKLMPTCCAYWLPGIPRQSNADKQKNITSTTCCIQRIQIQSYTSTCQRRKVMPTCCAYWLPGIPRQSNADNRT